MKPKTSSNGAATKIDEKVPTMIPIIIGKLNSAITDPPKKYIANRAIIVATTVRIVRDSVSLIDKLMISVIDILLFLATFSRMRSKITMVSFME